MRRTREISNLSNDYDSIRTQWFSGQQKPPNREKISEAVRNAMKAALNDGGSITSYSYRPFLQMFALLTSEVLSALSKAKGGGTRARPEVLSAFRDKDVVGLAIAPSPKELSASLAPFASFCWGIPDNDLTRRGNTHVFCNLFPDYKKRGKNWTGKLRSNVHAGLMKRLGLVDSNTLKSETAIAFYCYAVLSSGWYLARFEPALFKVKSWPRIPIPRDLEKFTRIVELGQKIARLEDFATEVQFDDKYKGLVDNWSEMKLTEYEIYLDEEKITLATQDGYVRTIPGVSKNIAEFSVNGYSVLREWLKFHSQPYLRSAFKREQLIELLSTCSRIRKHIELSVHIDRELSSFAERPEELLLPGR